MRKVVTEEETREVLPEWEETKERGRERLLFFVLKVEVDDFEVPRGSTLPFVPPF